MGRIFDENDDDHYMKSLMIYKSFINFEDP